MLVPSLKKNNKTPEKSHAQTLLPILATKNRLSNEEINDKLWAQDAKKSSSLQNDENSSAQLWKTPNERDVTTSKALKTLEQITNPETNHFSQTSFGESNIEEAHSRSQANANLTKILPEFSEKGMPQGGDNSSIMMISQLEDDSILQWEKINEGDSSEASKSHGSMSHGQDPHSNGNSKCPNSSLNLSVKKANEQELGHFSSVHKEHHIVNPNVSLDEDKSHEVEIKRDSARSSAPISKKNSSRSSLADIKGETKTSLSSARSYGEQSTGSNDSTTINSKSKIKINSSTESLRIDNASGSYSEIRSKKKQAADKSEPNGKSTANWKKKDPKKQIVSITTSYDPNEGLTSKEGGAIKAVELTQDGKGDESTLSNNSRSAERKSQKTMKVERIAGICHSPVNTSTTAGPVQHNREKSRSELVHILLKYIPNQITVRDKEKLEKTYTNKC